MGITNVTLPARSMRRKAFGANGASVVSVSRTSARAGRPKPSRKPPPRALVAVRKSRLLISHLLVGDGSGFLDRGPDARIGAAATDVPRHGAIDVRVGWLRLGGKQRARRHDLTRLAIATLGHVQRKPGGLHSLARRRGADSFNGGDPPLCRRRDRQDAGPRRLSVDVDRARATKGGATAELGAGHAEHIPEYPQQRHVVRDIDIVWLSIHIELGHCHSLPSRWTWTICNCSGVAVIAWCRWIVDMCAPFCLAPAVRAAAIPLAISVPCIQLANMPVPSYARNRGRPASPSHK